VSVVRWVNERRADVPTRLAARLDDVLGDRADGADRDVVAAYLDAADALLRDLLSRDSTGRDVALDLLTVDALVTYAFEAAARDPATLERCAEAAASRFASAVNA
jgi:hypothetical protein